MKLQITTLRWSLEVGISLSLGGNDESCRGFGAATHLVHQCMCYAEVGLHIRRGLLWLASNVAILLWLCVVQAIHCSKSGSAGSTLGHPSACKLSSGPCLQGLETCWLTRVLQWRQLGSGQPEMITMELGKGYQRCTRPSLEHVQRCNLLDRNGIVVHEVASCRDAWCWEEEWGACGLSQWWLSTLASSWRSVHMLMLWPSTLSRSGHTTVRVSVSVRDLEAYAAGFHSPFCFCRSTALRP